MQCPKCNQFNPPEAAFCLNCASSLAAPPPFVGHQQQQGQQQFPSPGYPVASQPHQAGGQEASQKPLIALILAISAFLCCGPLTGVPAAIVGWMELDAIKNGRSPASGKTMATIGFWGGIVASILHTIVTIIFILLSALSGGGGF